jgi:hypothetical protein
VSKTSPLRQGLLVDRLQEAKNASMNEAGFIDLVLSNAINREILSRLPALGLAEAWLVSGALFQTVWNRLTDRPVDHGIKDYDSSISTSIHPMKPKTMLLREPRPYFAI